MISPEDQRTIRALAKRYRAKRVLLFGSAARDAEQEPRDIDLAVEGVAPSLFFKLYGELIFGLSKPVDLIDLGVKSKFSDLVRKEGLPVYG